MKGLALSLALLLATLSTPAFARHHHFNGYYGGYNGWTRAALRYNNNNYYRSRPGILNYLIGGNALGYSGYGNYNRYGGYGNYGNYGYPNPGYSSNGYSNFGYNGYGANPTLLNNAMRYNSVRRWF